MSGLEIRPLTGVLGAEVFGLDASKPLDDETWDALHAAYLEHHVLARSASRRSGAASSLPSHGASASPRSTPSSTGRPTTPDVIRVHKPAGASASFGVGWHADNTFQKVPTGATVLSSEVLPPYGGDTLYANMVAAWEALSPVMQERLADLRAVHSASRAYDPALVGAEKYEAGGPLRYRMSDAVHEENLHPVMRTDPRTGKRILYVNPMFTLRIEGLTSGESDALLRFLFDHGASVDFQCRVRWAPGTVLVWDNACVWHYALDDYRPFERIMYRVTTVGERPA